MRGLIAALVLVATPAWAEPVRIGSKNFTESYLLAEIAAQHLEARGIEVVRQFGLGGTKICYDALRASEIDLYPEYTGTIAAAILGDTTLTDVTPPLAAQGLATYAPPGFNNTYVLALRKEVAESRGLTKISDLVGETGIDAALSHEFRARNDGWPALSTHYGLTLGSRGIEHGLAYEALASGGADLTDAYSTDGELSGADLVLLDDDRAFFPRYDAVWLARTTLAPDVVAALAELEGRIDEATMQALNARAALDGEGIATVAASFLATTGLADADTPVPSRFWSRLAENTARHIQLTLAALLLAGVVGVSLALVLQPFARAASALLYVCGLLQTIPSIALLALMIPLVGIGVVPAVIALFLYALLPIVRATLTAINAIEPVYLTVADALGMTASERRRHVLVPLAMPHIIAGLRTAAVIAIGTATLAAFIGAGGLGQPIVTGLALNDTGLILEGAVPAALLAIVTDLVFDLLERRLVPPHLRSA
ncbi:MAG: glycine betaine ABC transporter substrate-binding protein [Pseudomonadota bacterium]